jgi:glycosyltransferase involved in cell wall biosynthesis
VRILVLSFYYEPDLCPGSFRNTALVRALSEKLTADDEVEVITTAPNRYHSFAASAPQNESAGNIRIRRIPLPTHKSGIIDQSRAFVSYARGALKVTQNQSYDLVYASSSRLMTAFLGAILARRLRIPLCLDIRDIFTETISDMFPRSPVRLLLPLFKYMERFSIRSADWVNLVSPAFAEHFRKVDPTKSYRFFLNGIDSIDEGCADILPHQSEYKEILYAGNIGEGQGLHRVIPGIARRLPPSWRIRIIGDGGRRSVLEKAVSGLDNVILDAPIPRCQLVEYYRMASVLLVHLSDYPAFKNVLPSKLFEYAATGRPIIAGVEGQAATFIQENIDNAAIFPPCNVDGFFDALEELNFENTPRLLFCERYQRARITNEMATEMLALVNLGKHLGNSQGSGHII